MGNKLATLQSTFSVSDEKQIEDTRFMHIVIDIMHLGINRNGSYFEKSVVNECIDSIKNTPVLGFIKRDMFTDEEDFKGHEYILKKTENGIEEAYVGRAYGVIPESCNPRWVIKVCSDGLEREFLRVDALLWEKFSDATSIVRRDGEKSESMELEVSSVEGYEDENGVFHFTKFRFDGACILGDQVAPAMIDANVRINDGVNFTMSGIADSIRGELNDKLEKFNMAFAQFTDGEICSDQGGAKNMLNTELNQVEETTIETVEPEVAEVTEFEAETEVEVSEEKVEEVEEVSEEVEDQVEAEFEAETEVEAEAEVETSDNSSFEEEVVEGEPEEEAEAEEVVEEVEAEVEEVVEEDRFSEMQAEFEVLKADYEKVKADYDEAVSSFEKIKAEYDAVKSEYDEIKPKYDEYVQAEAQRVAEELSAQKDAAFAEYEADLAENAEFAALKEKKDEMSVEDIEKECAFLYVKITRAKNKFSAVEPQSAVVGVLSDIDSAESDGLVLTKYGYISTNR